MTFIGIVCVWGWISQWISLLLTGDPQFSGAQVQALRGLLCIQTQGGTLPLSLNILHDPDWHEGAEHTDLHRTKWTVLK